MDGRQRVVVETNLDERAGATLVDGKVVPRTRHARAKFVRLPKRGKPRAPTLGDPWCQLTVRARLERMADVFRQVPHDPDTKPARHRSCMPTPVREIFKDQPGEPMRIPVARTELTAAKQVLESLITFNRLKRIVIWSIANRISDRRLGRYIHKDGKTAARLKLILLNELANDWNKRQWPVDASDVKAARDFIHRNFD